jgi:hypothetical protein
MAAKSNLTFISSPPRMWWKRSQEPRPTPTDIIASSRQTRERIWWGNLILLGHTNCERFKKKVLQKAGSSGHSPKKTIWVFK